jgi:hypothetical protein
MDLMILFIKSSEMLPGGSENPVSRKGSNENAL